MLIYFIKYANKPRSPDLYDLNQKVFSIGSMASFVGKLSLVGTLTVIIFILILALLHAFSYWTTVTSSIMFVLNVINAVVILGLIYVYFLRQIQWGTKPRTVFELLKHVVFYIPCLFISLIETLTGVYNNTSHSVVLLLLVEAAVITAYFVIPLIIDYLNHKIGTILLEGPVFLNSKTSIGPFEGIHARTHKRESAPDNEWWRPLAAMATDTPGAAVPDVPEVPDQPDKATQKYAKWQCKAGIQEPEGRKRCGKRLVSFDKCTELGCCWDKKEGEVPNCYQPTTYEGETEEGSVSIKPEGDKGSTYTARLSLAGKPSASSSMPKDFNYRYALAFSFYINPQPASTNANYTKFTNIINYNECPIVEYRGSTNTLRVRMKQGKGAPTAVYEHQGVPLQRWNQVVVNYDGGTLDIFMNNDLVSTTASVVPFMTHNDTVVGHEDGINGGIRNVRYFREPLDRAKITLLHHSA